MGQAFGHPSDQTSIDRISGIGVDEAGNTAHGQTQ
jgi:hypothetical protein